MSLNAQTIEHAWQVLATVPDPEIPVINLVELGVVRALLVDGGQLIVRMTPTYAGCPAIEVMQADALAALSAAGIDARIEVVLSPAWTTDWLSSDTRSKLLAYGIAPPHTRVQNATQPLQFFAPADFKPPCPQCDSRMTEKLSEFGSTACKALYRCTACKEPFDYFKRY